MSSALPLAEHSREACVVWEVGVSLLTDKTTKQNRRLDKVVCSAYFGGLKRIRTAVRGFADLCLATRPSDQFRCFRFANIRTFIQFAKFPTKFC